MSEYWKSTPKYWCKNCSTYVRDTPFERRQHESTAKHQNNLKRFLRDIQNGHERNERDKQKAKAEVERLNKLTGSAAAHPTVASPAHTIRKSTTSAPTATDQKRQWSQLAEMGIQVPDSFRGEMAMAGVWQAVSKPKAQEAQEEESLSVGVRKRKLEDEDEEEQPTAQPRRNVWGKASKSYPGKDKSDLDALLSGHLPLKKERPETKDEKPQLPQDQGSTPSNTTAETDASTINPDGAIATQDGYVRDVAITREVPNSVAEEAIDRTNTIVKTESEDQDGEITIGHATSIPVFKKRKSKAPSSAV